MSLLNQIITFFKEEYRLELGAKFSPSEHTRLRFEIDNLEMDVHASVNVLKGNSISCISLKFNSENKSDIVRAYNGLRSRFEIKNTRDIDISFDFRNAFVFVLTDEKETKFNLKIVLWDNSNSILPNYSIELTLEDWE